MTSPEDIAKSLSEAQAAVLRSMTDGDMVYPMAMIADDAQVPVAETRRIIRQFHADGLADFGPLFGEDDGFVHGSGYWRSSLGYAVRSALGEVG